MKNLGLRQRKLEPMEAYLGLLITFGLAALIAGGFLLAGFAFGPKNPSPEKAIPFECGVDPFELPSGRFAVKFYLVAMLFIIFDVELVFLFPWAVLARDLGLFGFIQMLIFLAVLSLALAYAWREGALEWE